jgi:hypothetical protein
MPQPQIKYLSSHQRRPNRTTRKSCWQRNKLISSWNKTECRKRNVISRTLICWKSCFRFEHLVHQLVLESLKRNQSVTYSSGPSAIQCSDLELDSFFSNATAILNDGSLWVETFLQGVDLFNEVVTDFTSTVRWFVISRFHDGGIEGLIQFILSEWSLDFEIDWWLDGLDNFFQGMSTVLFQFFSQCVHTHHAFFHFQVRIVLSRKAISFVSSIPIPILALPTIMHCAIQRLLCIHELYILRTVDFLHCARLIWR